MHGEVKTENGLSLMAADLPSSMEYSTGSNFSVSLSGDDESELRGYWDKLIDGGTITQPLEMAPWGDSFGMCVDRFGISWLVNISGSGQEG